MPFPRGSAKELGERNECWKSNSPLFITLRPSQYFLGFSFFGTVASWEADQNYYIPHVHMMQGISDGGTISDGYVIATLGRQEADGDVMGGMDPDPIGGPIASVITSLGGTAGASGGAADTTEFFNFEPYGLYVNKGDTLLVSVLANGNNGDCDWLLDCRLTLIPTFA